MPGLRQGDKQRPGHVTWLDVKGPKTPVGTPGLEKYGSEGIKATEQDRISEGDCTSCRRMPLTNDRMTQGQSHRGVAAITVTGQTNV